MCVGQQTLRHGHRQIWNTGLLDERADFVIGLRVGCALAENDERLSGALQKVDSTLDRVRSRDLLGRGIDYFDQRSLPSFRFRRLREEGVAPDMPDSQFV